MPRQARDNKQKVRKTNQKRGMVSDTHTHAGGVGEGQGRIRGPCSGARGGKKKTPAFAVPFYAENDPFTKTGLGQTWGKHSKTRRDFLQEAEQHVDRDMVRQLIVTYLGGARKG